MSFILDALKKSESDRQRQGGPALFEVKVAAPRSALPVWAIAIGLLFAANLGVVLWLLLRQAPASLVAPAARSPAAGSLAAAAPRASPAVEPAVLVSSPPAAPAAMPPAAANLPGANSPAAVGPPATPAAAPTLNSDDYAPAAEAPAASGGLGHVTRGTEAGVPLYQQLAASPGGTQLPQLHLDLQAYADRPEDRWVLINMHKLREGDSLPEGVRVERITPDGAVLSWHGDQFLLTQ
jgi:general secretion pathway protein B